MELSLKNNFRLRYFFSSSYLLWDCREMLGMSDTGGLTVPRHEGNGHGHPQTGGGVTRHV